MGVMLAIVVILVLSVLSAWAWLLRDGFRRFFEAHPVLTALTVMPLQPLLLIGVVSLAISIGDDFRLSYLAICLAAYVSGLVAFAVVIAIHDLRAERQEARRRS
ncbi:hypothetical protein OIE66_24330 [Nonomuraea sp. NBC_01738]|uniref:hypothetical protein n=1 Tax=Nonomuraea sp. NBC_01738 TaxID=2976003 RepID=UPI002E1579B8|nr:hypothetical protein OIE66_24330 [Nonomuraea sp. NBC_01738]